MTIREFDEHPEGVAELPEVRRIEIADLKTALSNGLADFTAMPSHAIFLCLIYPIIGIALIRLALGADVLPLLFPLAAGFALIGPFAALGLYELSRRRERGLSTDPRHVLALRRSPALGSILVLGAGLMVIFFVWLTVAQSLYEASFGYAPAATIPDFIGRLFSTAEGWRLIFVGNLIGFFFALAVLMISVVSFPLLLDQKTRLDIAVATSVRACLLNPVPMAAWGLIVAVLLVVGMIPLFFGLAVVLPILGHATWHLYRRLIGPPPAG